MNQEQTLQLILEKLGLLEQGQKSLEQGQSNLKEELLNEIRINRQAILELQTEVQQIKQSMRFYDYKLVEHEKQLFKLKS
ncbi:MAG TPA: hypothetical protein VJ824_14830 [Bacillota bacterium]|nr:hypothetical protein [Bacillota bacterium]